VGTSHEAFGDLPVDADLTVIDDPASSHVMLRRWEIALVIAVMAFLLDVEHGTEPPRDCPRAEGG